MLKPTADLYHHTALIGPDGHPDASLLSALAMALDQHQLLRDLGAYSHGDAPRVPLDLLGMLIEKVGEAVRAQGSPTMDPQSPLCQAIALGLVALQRLERR